jgi:cyclopropane fatty-acyl-phospholipid synthase-like methyltransferase
MTMSTTASHHESAPSPQGMPHPDPKRVATHYDAVESQLASVLMAGHMHLGYWQDDSDTANLFEGALALTKVMIAQTRIETGQRFCDFGCGVGGPALELALAKGCAIEGITLSAFQADAAQKAARRLGLDNQVRFVQGNVVDYPLPAESFDGAWFFESIFHMGHGPALTAAHRALKAGAYLHIADLTATNHLHPRGDGFANSPGAEWVLGAYETATSYPETLRAHGFELVEYIDISPHVMPMLVSKLKQSLTQHRKVIVDAVGEAVLQDAVNAYRFMSENLSYVLVTAKRI